MKRWLLRLLVVLTVLSGLSVIGLKQFYTRYRPESKQVELGRTVAINGNYGKTIFVTVREKRLLDVIYASPLVPGFGLLSYMIVLYIYERRRRRAGG